MKFKYFMSILIALCIIFETSSLSIFALATTTESVEEQYDTESQDDLSESLRLDSLVAGEDYVENEIIVCGKSDEFENDITKYEEEYDLTLEFCFSDDNTGNENGEAITYLMSTNETSVDVIDVIEDLQKDESVVYAQPNFIYSYEDTETSNVSIVNENQLKNYSNSQEDMFLTLFNKSSDWKANGGSNILIAIIDSGMY